jgi:type II secretion system protein J
MKTPARFHWSDVMSMTLRAFTLIEIMVSVALLAIVVGAIYSTYASIIKASKVGLDAAVASQRERTAMRVIEDALASAQLFVANPNHYSFSGENGSEAWLAFTARLPQAFPRSGKFGDYDVRKVRFSLENGGGHNQKQLVLRQCPILWDMDEDERFHPVVLADDVKKIEFDFWDVTSGDWVDDWLLTNQLPKMVRVTLQLNYAGTRGVDTSPIITRVVALPTAGAQPNWQSPGGGAPPPPNPPNPPGLKL